MGPFHLALASRAPIVTAIVRGASDCQPVGTHIASPGVVEVQFLPEISTEDFTEDNLREKRDELRALFVSHLRQDNPG